MTRIAELTGQLAETKETFLAPTEVYGLVSQRMLLQRVITDTSGQSLGPVISLTTSLKNTRKEVRKVCKEHN